MTSTIIAPYITEWSGETDLPYELVESKGFGIAYADESVIDRDDRGVLWYRTPSLPRQGQPLFGQVHPHRQRRAMRRLLCQVCGGPADRTSEGFLWLLQDHREDWPAWPDRMAVTEPPICVPCVRVSTRLCPALRKGAVTIRAEESPIVGVRGTLFRSGNLAPVAVRGVMVAFDDPAIHWVLARNLLRELRGCSIVPLAGVC